MGIEAWAGSNWWGCASLSPPFMPLRTFLLWTRTLSFLFYSRLIHVDMLWHFFYCLEKLYKKLHYGNIVLNKPKLNSSYTPLAFTVEIDKTKNITVKELKNKWFSTRRTFIGRRVVAPNDRRFEMGGLRREKNMHSNISRAGGGYRWHTKNLFVCRNQILHTWKRIFRMMCEKKIPQPHLPMGCHVWNIK